MRYRIGDFARLGGTSIKTLRYYDDLGLLEPAEVDARTRYRYYTAAQLPRLTMIRALQELGASLEDIRRVVSHGSGDERHRLLHELRDRAVRTLERTHRSLRWIELELEEARDSTSTVVLKRRPPARVASIRARLRSYADIGELERALARCVSREAALGVRGVLWHRCEASGAIEGEPFVEIDRRARRSVGCELRELPAVTVASAYCATDDDAAIRAYETIDRWIHGRGFQLDGPKRELYVGHMLEIQFPVK